MTTAHAQRILEALAAIPTAYAEIDADHGDVAARIKAHSHGRAAVLVAEIRARQAVAS